MTRKWVSASALAAGLVAILAVWHFGGIPGEGPLIGALNSAGHFPLFGLFAAIVFVSLRRFASPFWQEGWRAYLFTVLTMLLVSGVTEWSQQFTDRNVSLWDFTVNMAGTLAALALIALRDPELKGGIRAHTWRLALGAAPVMLAGVVLLPVAGLSAALVKRGNDFPCIACPSDRRDLWMIEASGASVRLARDAGESRPHLEISLQEGAFPGVSWEWPVADWTGFDALVLELSNPGDVALSLTLRIDDAQHDFRFGDRFNHRLTLAPGSGYRECIPLTDIQSAPEGRPMDLSRIARVMLFGGARAHGQRFWLHHIGLSDAAEGC